MARGLRTDIGDLVYHVINRANGRFSIFEAEHQYRDFEFLLDEVHQEFRMRILAYVIMPNHWHLLLHPLHDGDLSRAMQWLGNTHTRRHHSQTRTIGTGHLYQGRYKSFLVEDDTHLLTVLKYIERNPVRARLSDEAEGWRWGSAYQRIRGTEKESRLLTFPPVSLPPNYREWINEPEPSEELKSIRHSILKGVPYGGRSWQEQMIGRYQLEQTITPVGRPRNIRTHFPEEKGD